ncbi:MAG: MFS transporter [Brevinematales bacterium]|nr:MFS transporter [Brevinematales bacterium]
MASKKLDRNVIITGITSFFTDVSSEMVYPILQAFIATVMSATKALLGPILGVIEGVAESTASLLKVFAGYWSDKLRKRKGLTVAGYGTSAAAKILFLLAGMGWYFVMLARFFDRVGKGIRTAPRDALISESTPKDSQGRAFGFQRGMDFAGATLGALICYFLARAYLDPVAGQLINVDSFFNIFLISIIPAFLGVAALFFLREKKAGTAVDAPSEKKERPLPNLRIGQYDRNLKAFFLAQFVFTLGNSSNQFLLLRSMELGHLLSTVILMYLGFNLAATLLSPVFGSLSDKIGRKKILVLGYGIYGAVYAAFGFIAPEYNFLIWGFWVVYGIYYAMTEGVEKAMVSDLAPAGSKATALGFYHTIVGIGLLPASIIAGFLFSLMPGLPFWFGGVTSAVSVIILAVFVREKR